ncbi:MAG: hypothetical protein NXI10_12765 [bacterium]|nr:hypothetical protein [bacterium]
MRYFTFALLFTLFSCNQEDTATPPKDTQQQKEISETAETSETGNSKNTEEAPTEAPLPELTEEQETAAAPKEFDDMDWAEFQESMTKDFSFVIIISTKSYDAALKRAKDASEKLGYPIDLRGLHENKEIGLSFSREVCEDEICGGGLSYPIYIPRSDWGEEKYVSIEYSDAFDGFTKGYYIVVVASGEKGAPVVKETLSKAKKFYKDAYTKTCGVYMGCGC